MAACAPKPQEGSAALDTIHARVSVRSFTDEPLTDAQIETLLRAAMAAPSGMNVQPWRFVVITDPDVKAAVYEKIPQKSYAEAAALFVVCGETGWDWNGERRDNGNWTADCAAATENLLLAATAQGLGAVWTACYPYPDRMDPVRAILGIPEGVNPYCVIPVGHPAVEEMPKDKWKPENIHYDRW